MNYRSSPHGIGGARVRGGITHICITALCFGMKHTVLNAGLVDRSGRSIFALKMGISALPGRYTHLLPFSLIPMCRGPPSLSWLFVLQTKKAGVYE